MSRQLKDAPKVINRRYVLQGLLGAGASGSVYRAQDRWFDNRMVALKLLRGVAANAETLLGFQSEFASMARFRHPNLVEVYDFGKISGREDRFLTMELLPGRTLGDVPVPLPPEECLDVLIQACQALDYIHARGFLHQDIKPGNLLLAGEAETGDPLRVKLADFGMALGPDRAAGSSIQGTLQFMAPERFHGGSADRRGDLYSLGAVLFYLATGQPPFHDVEPRRLVDRMMQGPPAPADCAGVRPAGLRDVLRKLLEPTPGRRYPSAAALVEDVNRATGAKLSLDTRATRLSMAHGARLVGRDPEMEEITSYVRSLASAGDEASRRPRLVILQGEAGIGKSRLVEEARICAQVEGVHVIHGDFAATRTVPLGPWPEVLRRSTEIVAALPGNPMDRARLRDLLPPVEALWRKGPPAATLPTGGAAKERLLVSVTRWLQEATRQAPLLLCLEELAEARSLSREILRRLVCSPHPTRLLLLATTGEVAGKDAPEPLGRLPLGTARTLPLSRLDPAQVSELLGSMLGIPEPPPPLVAAIHRETGGTPLLVEATVFSLIEERRLVRGPEGWRLSRQMETPLQLPSGTLEVIRQRLSRLGDDDRQALEAVALAGRPVGPDELAAVLEARPGPLERRLERLVSRHLLEAGEDPASARVFDVPNEALREVVRQDCGPAKQRRLHRRFGEELATREHPPLQELARHFAGAGDRGLARQYTLAAAQEAHGLHAYEIALPLYRQALDLLPAAASAERAQLRRCIAEAHEAVGANHRAVEEYRLARAEAAAPIDPSLDAALAERIGWNASLAGEFDTAQENTVRALALFREVGDEAGQAKAGKNLGVLYSRKGELDTAEQHYEEALEILTRLGDEDGVASLLNNLGLLQSFRGDHPGAMVFLERALEMRRRMEDRAGQVGPLLNLGFVQANAGDHGRALETFEACLKLTHGLGDLQNRGNTLMHRAESLRAIGALDRALQSWEEALRTHQETGDRARELHCYDRIGDLHRYLVDPAVAAEHHRRALALAEELGDPVQEAYARASLGLDQLGLGDSQASRNLESALAAGRQQENRRVEARALRGLALADAMRGDWAAMAARADRLILVSETADLGEDRTWGQRLLGEAQLGLDQIEAGRRTLQEASAAARRLVLPEVEREAQLLLAGSLHKGGHLGDALDARLRAEQILEEMSVKIRDEELRAGFVARAQRPASAASPPGKGTGAAHEPPPAAARQSGSLGQLYDISQAINSILDPEALLERVVDLAIEKVGADRGVIILFDGPGGEMRVRVARNTERETLDDAIAYSRHVVREAADGRPVLSVDVGEDDRFRDFRSVRMYGIRSLLCVPLRLRGNVVGTVYLDSRQPEVAFGEEDLHFLEVFANMTALALHNARSFDGLRKENLRLREEIQGRFSYGNIVGKSARMQQMFQIMEKVTDSALPVLVLGESGTGKELVASAIHFNGPRKNARFCSQNCAALPETLLESELFGHLRGAFTGAESSRQGLFELADGGTLFLDEIGDMSLAMQGKVLRAIQDGEIRPVGGSKATKVNVRFLSATNRNLEQLLKDGRFREDLYYRLNVVRLTLPPLRDRKEDIPLLVDHFLRKAGEEVGRSAKRLGDDALSLLVRYHWPGNVRELENEVKKLAVFSDGEVITLEDINRHQDLFIKLTDLSEDSPLESIEEVERKQIVRALLETGGHRGRAAKILGISRATIFRKIKQFEISI